MSTFRVPVILMYHSVRLSTAGSIYRTAITPDCFAAHIDFVTTSYRVLPLLEFVEALASRTRTEGIASITFDDGFLDNLMVARDILEKYRAPATVFIPTGFVGRSYFWWDALHAVYAVASDRPDLARSELQAQFPDLHLAPDLALADCFATTWDHMRRRPLDETYATVEELTARFAVPPGGLPRPVTLSEMKKLAEWPFEVGSHAVSHRPLPAMSIEEAENGDPGVARLS